MIVMGCSYNRHGGRSCDETKFSSLPAACDGALRPHSRGPAEAEGLVTLGLSVNKAIAAESIMPENGPRRRPRRGSRFRRITSLATLRDLNPMMHDRMQQVCYYLRVTTPFGKRIVEIITSYTLGKGVRSGQGSEVKAVSTSSRTTT